MYCLQQKKFIIFILFSIILSFCHFNCKKIKVTNTKAKFEAKSEGNIYYFKTDSTYGQPIIDVEAELNKVKNKIDFKTFFIEGNLAFTKIRLEQLFAILFKMSSFEVIHLKNAAEINFLLELKVNLKKEEFKKKKVKLILENDKYEGDVITFIDNIKNDPVSNLDIEIKNPEVYQQCVNLEKEKIESDRAFERIKKENNERREKNEKAQYTNADFKKKDTNRFDAEQYLKELRAKYNYKI